MANSHIQSWQRHIFKLELQKVHLYTRHHHTSKSLLPILNCPVMSRFGARASSAPPSIGCGNSIGSWSLNSRLLARPAFCFLRRLGLRFGRGGHLQSFLCLPGPRTQTLPLFTGTCTCHRQLAAGSGNNLRSVIRISTIVSFIIAVRPGGAEILLFTRT